MKNPFEYEGSYALSTDDIIDFYIEDFNYSRFIQSSRNIFLVGERGTGKTMALMYNSYRVQYHKAKRENSNIKFDKIGIHIPCNTPFFHKNEYQLINDPYKASIVCEHYLVLSILSQIIGSLIIIPEITEAIREFDISLKEEFEYSLAIKLIPGDTFLEGMRKFVNREVIETQKFINDPSSDTFYRSALSFSSLIIPFLNGVKRLPILKASHFMLMIDDAHDLNPFQTKTLNSWIAYRDHEDYSFKVAIAKIGKKYSFHTSSGGDILDGHDFALIEMEKWILNKDSDFTKMANRIIQRRLDKFKITAKVEDFFPINPTLQKDLNNSVIYTRSEAKKLFPNGTSKQISDHVYKFSRVHYFRSRPAKANRPPYSGFDTIVNLSSGVIRNLLEPCYWMYDNVISEQGENITHVPWTVQTRIILERSEAKWEMIRQMHRYIDGCSELQSTQIYQFFDNLMILFRDRLLNHKSEPRAITFTISGKDHSIRDRVETLLLIAQKAQLLYLRTSSSKDDGSREVVYIPNRILLPSRGLDPVGQHAHVQLKANEIILAAEQNKPFSYLKTSTDRQQTLFD